ncbi:MAG: hypothetical protein A2W19_08335 [Spirochaetes bacterium RBG_16_49_21]|nr:MAG: hypothetical protein A2W19_08335 [Spirochaetes bacterium RBG_16_49_21]
MKMRIMHIIVPLLFLFPASAPAWPDRILKVKAVEFRGLKLLSKYDIIRGVRLKSSGNGIIIDADSLNEALAGNYFIETYRIEERGPSLIITIAEKKPHLIVAVEKGGTSLIYELDSGYRILSRNDVHAVKVPILHISERDARDDLQQSAVRRLFAVLDRVKRNNAPIYRELSEIYLDEEKIRILLRGRKTDFILRPDESDFIKLRCITGYCDRRRQYPDRIIIAGNAAIIR